jgi:DNA polymerase I
MYCILRSVYAYSMSEARPVLIVDSLNLFVRSYCAYPTMSSHGYQMGGCIGFLKTLRRIVMEIQPSAVYVCWEGGGSSRRRKLLPEYKLNRVAGKLNRFYEDDIPESEDNRQHQTLTLLAMLKCAPVCQLYASDCEGDDLVAYLCCGPMRNVDKVIVSSDKDLFQLLDDRTKLYSLHKKTFVTKESVMEEFRVQASNFALAKALCGDPGDNIPGVKGIGFKTVSKLFPMLGLEDPIILQDVFDFCHTHEGESKLYQRILEHKDDVQRNWKLVYLDGSMVPANQQAANEQRIKDFIPRDNRMGLVKLLVKEGIGDFDIQDFFSTFYCIDNLQMATGDT